MNRLRMIVWGSLGLVAAVVVYVIAGSGGGGYIVRAEFRDVDGLRQGSTVKIDGVPAGTVSSLTITPQYTAMATLTLDRSAAPIGAGASVQVRPTDLLGEHYAQLNVGNLSRPQPSGTLIPMSRTSTAVELDDVLNMLDADTRTRLRILINEAGVALAGRGADFNTLLSELPPDLGQAQALLGQVASENATLQNLIAQGDRITAAVNGKRDQLGRLIAVADEALDSGRPQAGPARRLAQQRTGCADPTAHGARSARRGVRDDHARRQEPAGDRRAADRNPAGAAVVRTFRSAQATLVTARRVAPQISSASDSRARSPLVSLLCVRPRPAGLDSVSRQAAPILNEENRRAMRDLLWFIENWALAMKGRDAFGHVLGAELEIDPSILISAVDSFVQQRQSAGWSESQAARRQRDAPSGGDAERAAGNDPGTERGDPGARADQAVRTGRGVGLLLAAGRKPRPAPTRPSGGLLGAVGSTLQGTWSARSRRPSPTSPALDGERPATPQLPLCTDGRNKPEKGLTRRFRGRAAGNQRGRTFTLAVGFGVLIFFAAQFYVGFEAPNSIPGRGYYTIYAQLKDADNLNDHDQVRIGGLLAGQVLDPHLHDHLARCGGGPTPAGVVPATAVGQHDRDPPAQRGRRAVRADLSPGEHGKPIPNNGVLAPSQALFRWISTRCSTRSAHRHELARGSSSASSAQGS